MKRLAFLVVTTSVAAVLVVLVARGADAQPLTVSIDVSGGMLRDGSRFTVKATAPNAATDGGVRSVVVSLARGEQIVASVGQTFAADLHADYVTIVVELSTSLSLANGSYTVSVTANKHSSGEFGGNSVPVSLNNPAPDVQDVVVAVGEDRLPRVRWCLPVAPVPDLLGYDVERQVDDGEFVALGRVAADELEYVDGSPPAGPVRYRVAATRDSGDVSNGSDPSPWLTTGEVTVTAPAEPSGTAGADPVEVRPDCAPVEPARPAELVTVSSHVESVAPDIINDPDINPVPPPSAAPPGTIFNKPDIRPVPPPSAAGGDAASVSPRTPVPTAPRTTSPPTPVPTPTPKDVPLEPLDTRDLDLPTSIAVRPASTARGLLGTLGLLLLGAAAAAATMWAAAQRRRPATPPAPAADAAAAGAPDAPKAAAADAPTSPVRVARRLLGASPKHISTATALVVGVSGAYYVIRPNLKPSTENVVKVTNVAVEPDVSLLAYARHPAVRGALDRAGGLHEFVDVNCRALGRVGTVVHLNYEVKGFADRRISVRWSLVDGKTGVRLSESEDNDPLPLTFQAGKRDADVGSWELWIPAPPRHPSLKARVELYDTAGKSRIAFADSPEFAAPSRPDQPSGPCA